MWNGTLWNASVKRMLSLLPIDAPEVRMTFERMRQQSVLLEADR